MSYVGPACRSEQHESCPGFWAAKFGGGDRGTTCSCACHGDSGRCLAPSCSRPMPCPIHGAPSGRRSGGRDDDLDDDEEEETDVPDDDGFPIPDYDDLRVSQLVAALDEINDVDRLEWVREWEEDGHQRVTVLNAIDRRIALLEGGGIVEDEVENPYEEYYDDEEEAEEEEALTGALAGYHHRSIFDIIDMLDELDDSDLITLVEVEEHGRARQGILGRAYALLEERGYVAVDEDEGFDDDDLEEELDEEEEELEEELDEEEPAFPIDDYDRLRVREIVAALDGLDVDELGWVREHEAGSRQRATVLRAIDRLVAERQVAETEEEEEQAAAGEEEEARAGAESPIEGYDRLPVFQILGLLPDLDDDQLVAVAEMEEQGAGRGAILDRVDALLDERGYQFADEEEAEEEPGIVASEPEPEPEPQPEPEPEPERAGGSPIDDYDRRTLFQILRILPDLDDDQLVAVAEIEEQGAGRAAILDRVDALLDERGYQFADEAPEPEPEPQPEPEQPSAQAEAAFPVADYDRLKVKDLVARLEPLDLDDLERVRQREAAGRSRATVLRAVERLTADRRADADALAALLAAAPADDAAEAPQPEEPPPADAEAEAPEAAEGDVESPIDDYDGLNVFQILRILPDLDDDELEAVAVIEERGRNRLAILERIDELLGP